MSRETRSTEGICDDCALAYVTPWYAPNFLWNLVVGGLGTTHDPGKMLCVECFMRRAENRGVVCIWKVTAE